MFSLLITKPHQDQLLIELYTLSTELRSVSLCHEIQAVDVCISVLGQSLNTTEFANSFHS